MEQLGGLSDFWAEADLKKSLADSSGHGVPSFWL